MNAFKFERHGRDFGVSRACLRIILGRYTGLPPREVPIEYAEQGKPKLTLNSCRPPLHFNVSHSGSLTLVAVAHDREVGVDIEKIRPFPEIEAIAERFFTRGERDGLRRLPPAEKEPGFFRCWTRKEAYIKARGEGLGVPLDQFEVTVAPDLPARLCHLGGQTDKAGQWWMADLQPGPGYVAAVAGEGNPARLQLWNFAGDQV
jgi:4'-phosphopantetheinyl transferase